MAVEISTIDLIKHAAASGILLSPSIAKEVAEGMKVSSLAEASERSRYEVKVWDGTGDPPVGRREEWLSPDNAIGRAAQRAIDEGKCVYFLFQDGKLLAFQPFAPDEGGYRFLEKDDESHPKHWKRVAEEHIQKHFVEPAVRAKMLDQALERALFLHEERKIPVGLSAVQALPRRAG